MAFVSMTSPFLEGVFLIAAIGFIVTLQSLSSVKTAKKGNMWGMIAMGLSLLGGLACLPFSVYPLVSSALVVGGIIGWKIAVSTPMMALPQLMAAFHSLVGLAAVCIAAATLLEPEIFGLGVGNFSVGRAMEMGLGASVGALTFTGSVMAFLKLQGSALLRFLSPLIRHGVVWRNVLALFWVVSFCWFLVNPSGESFCLMTGFGLGLGIFLVLPIGGADMPVVVSMLNSYSGWAASGIGFTLSSPLLIIVGALVGSSGAILSYVMCEAMNRPFWRVILGKPLSSSLGEEGAKGPQSFKQGNSEDAAFLLQNAQHVLIIPGYGMAVAQAQHALKEMVDVLRQQGVSVRFAIHPVAGRMPGHMNVLLAEAQVPYDDVKELEEVNGDFTTTDVAFVIGANDITNPSAKNDPTSPLFGMPILEVERARTVLFVKRSMAAGYAGIDNPLFYDDKTFMLLGDAKHVCESVTKSLRAAA